MSAERLARMDAFVQAEVEQWTAYMAAQLRAGVARKGIVVSGEFLRTIAARAANEGLQKASVALSFDTAGRFADMGAGNAYRLGKYQGSADRAELLKGRKGNKVYSRTAYGTLSTLMNNMANMYLERVPDLIKQTLTDGTDKN